MRCAAAILCVMVLALAARGDILPSAGSVSVVTGAGRGESHGWVALPLSEPKGGAAIVHLPPRHAEGRADAIADAEEGSVRLALRLPRMPERLGAWSNQLWIVFGPEGGGHPRRRVLSLSVERGPLGGSWSSPDTEGRLPQLPSLPGEGELAGFVGSAWGPVALIRGNDPLGPAWTMLVLTDSEWRSAGLPPELLGSTVGGEAARLALLAVPGGVALMEFDRDGGRLWSAQLRGAGMRRGGEGAIDWSRTDFPVRPGLEPGAAKGSTAAMMAAGQLIYATIGENGRIELWNPGRSGVRRLSRLEGVAADVGLVPLDQVGRLALVWQEPDPTVPVIAGGALRTHITEVSALTGATLCDGPAKVDGPVSAAELKLLALLLVGVMVIVLLFVLRPDESGHAAALPVGLALAEPGRRMAAAGIDLIIAVLGAAWIRHTAPQELLAPAMLLYDPAGVGTLLLVIVLGIAHCAMGEWLTGRSVGKFLTRCRVVHVSVGSAQGQVTLTPERPSLWRALVRNLVRWTLPPVAITGLGAPDHRHRGDLAAGTMVVIPAEVGAGDG